MRRQTVLKGAEEWKMFKQEILQDDAITLSYALHL